MDTRSAAGRPGTAGSPWRCSPTRLLTVITAAERAIIPTPDGLIPITIKEQRRLIDDLILRPIGAWPTPAVAHRATPTPGPSPPLSLPAPGAITLITNYHCRIGQLGGRPERIRLSRL